MGSRLKWIVVVTLALSSLKAFSLTDNDKVEFKKTELVLFASSTAKVGKKIIVELAESENQHERGLMFRKSLSKNNGMLFVFSDEEVRNFWMKNTLIDLSIGYFNKDKKLIDVQEMKAINSILQRDIPGYPSQGPAQYALEMPAKWFGENHIRIGAVFRLKGGK